MQKVCSQVRENSENAWISGHLTDCQVITPPIHHKEPSAAICVTCINRKSISPFLDERIALSDGSYVLTTVRITRAVTDHADARPKNPMHIGRDFFGKQPWFRNDLPPDIDTMTFSSKANGAHCHTEV